MRVRNHALDGLRGLAALGVLTLHVWMFTVQGAHRRDELVAPVGALHREHPHVQGEDAERGEATQAVEGMVADAHPSGPARARARHESA